MTFISQFLYRKTVLLGLLGALTVLSLGMGKKPVDTEKESHGKSTMRVEEPNISDNKGLVERISDLVQGTPYKLADVLLSVGTSERYRNRIRQDPREMGVVLDELIHEMQEHVDNKWRYAEIQGRLDRFADDVTQMRMEFPQSAADRAADALIDLFRARLDRFPERGYFIAKFVAKRGNSEKAKDFLHDILAGSDKNLDYLQDVTVKALCWRRELKADQRIFEAVHDIFKRNPEYYTALAAMSRLDAVRSESVLLKGIGKAKTVRQFNKISGIISQMHNPKLFGAALRKVNDFPQGQGYDNDPTQGIYMDALSKHIKEVEDGDLEVALDVLLKKAGKYSSFSTLSIKLQSPSQRSRIAVLNCLARLFSSGFFNNEQSQDLIQSQLERETDPVVRQVAERTLSILNPKKKTPQ